MASFEQYRASYEANWAKLRIRPERAAEVKREAQKLLAGKTRYLASERRTGVPWWFIGLTHYRESHYNFMTYLGNGQPLNKRTTIVPIGRGPFASFEDGAEDAMRQMTPGAPTAGPLFSSPKGFYGPGVLSNLQSRLTGQTPDQAYKQSTPLMEGLLGTTASQF